MREYLLAVAWNVAVLGGIIAISVTGIVYTGTFWGLFSILLGDLCIRPVKG